MEISNQNVEVSKTLIKDGKATKKKKSKPKAKWLEQKVLLQAAILLVQELSPGMQNS